MASREVNATENLYPVEDYSLSNTVKHIILCLNVLSFGFSFFGNGSVAILAVRKWTRSKANFYVLAMAVSDIFLTIFCVPFTLLTNLINYHWIFGEFLCSAVGYLQTACVLQRAFTLIASSMDRHFAICKPLKKQPTKSCTLVLIGVIYSASFLVPVPIAYLSKIEDGLCLEFWPSDNYRRIFSGTLLLLTYVIPLVVLTITYAKICLVLAEKPPGEEVRMLRRRQSAKRKTMRIFMLSFFAYALCWLPIHVITLIGDFNPSIYDSKFVHVLWLIFQWLAVANSSISAIIVLALKTRFFSKIKDTLLFRRTSQNSILKSRRLTRNTLI